MITHRVLHADYHRNGVGGAGFYVGLFEDGDDGGTKIMIAFPEYDDESGTLDFGRHWENVAVLDIHEAAKGNIYMFPDNGQPGGNAWRGADRYTNVRNAIAAEKIGEVEEP